jgi:hypothetical protein
MSLVRCHFKISFTFSTLQQGLPVTLLMTNRNALPGARDVGLLVETEGLILTGGQILRDC